MSNFKQDYLRGKVVNGNIQRYIYMWNIASTKKSLQEFLGLTNHEYQLMLLDDGSLRKELDSLKKAKNIILKSIDQFFNWKRG